MITIDRLAKIDSLATRMIAALHKCVEWAGDYYEARLVDAAYRVADSKAAAIGKIEDKLSDLGDADVELVAYGTEARALLREKYKAALAALDKELSDKRDKLDSDLVAASEALVAAHKAYDSTIREANEKLGVEVDA